MRSGFFNSELTGYDPNGMPIFDRAEDAEFLALVYSTFFTSGIFGNPSNAYQVSVDESMTVNINPGKCIISGYFGWEDEIRKITLQESSGLDRIDTIVLRLDLSSREIDLYALTGTPANTPVAPELTRPVPGESGDVYELGLANVLIPKNSTALSDVNITDTRFASDRCGIVTGTVEEIDFSTLTQQFEAFMEQYEDQIGDRYELYEAAIVQLENNANTAYDALLATFDEYAQGQRTAFEAWFETIRGILDEDVAGHIQNEIDAIDARHATEDSLKPWGYTSKNTVFSADGSIVETDTNGTTTTTFNADNSIQEVWVGRNASRRKTTVFNSDGSITETVVNVSVGG